MAPKVKPLGGAVVGMAPKVKPVGGTVAGLAPKVKPRVAAAIGGDTPKVKPIVSVWESRRLCAPAKGGGAIGESTFPSAFPSEAFLTISPVAS